ncbi:DUF58 domain-containing protein [Anaerosporobacter faecicola]|uniref:DUF58 domain-containing protein n=1 Tax=Anaerosporobacter faecicola TaxID=2718714 RepID=UPI00143BEF60|nr:DUF58 domain-containing protein [Anaerosporobacter faecicola]
MDLILFFLIIVLVTKVMERIYEKIWYRQVNACVTFEEEEVVEGEGGTITEVLENAKGIPLPSIILKFALDRSIDYLLPENTSKSDFQYRNDCIVAMPYEKITRKFQVTYRKRGYFTISEVQLVASDPLYKNIYIQKITENAAIYVYPGCTKCKEVIPCMERMMGEYLNQRFLYEDPFAFRGIRNYESTDPMKKINWNVSAKTGELMVNQYYDSNHCSISIFLNLESEGMLYYEELQEESIRIARTYLERFLQKGIPIKLITNGMDVVNQTPISIEEGAGCGHLQESLRKLARIQIKQEMPSFLSYLEEANHQKCGMAVLISVSQSEALQEAFEQFIGKEGYGQWIIPVHLSTERRITSTKVEVVYGEVI